MIRLIVIAVALLAVAGCSSDWMKWPRQVAGNANTLPADTSAEPTPDEPAVAPAASQNIVDRVESVETVMLCSGVMLIAVGYTRHEGATNSELAALNNGRPDGDGILRYEFRITPFEDAAPSASASEQLVTLSQTIDASRLVGVKAIEVIGDVNSAMADIPG